MSVATMQGLAAGTWSIDPVHSHVGFSVKHMVVATFRGRFEEYSGSLTVAEDGSPRLEGSVVVDSIVVKDENLAAHLKSPDFFDSEHHPRIDFQADEVRVEDGGDLEVRGRLTIKGHTNEVSARGNVSGPHVNIAGNEGIGVELETVIDRRQYGLDWNAPLPKGGFALENDVKLEISLELVRQA